MNALILIAHGSRREASNQEVIQLTSEISSKLRSSFSIIQTAFLELASPSIEDAVRSTFDKGVQSVFLFPYFLSAGKHVEQDIPTIVQGLQQEYPEHSIKTLPYLGTIPNLQELIISHVKQGTPN